LARYTVTLLKADSVLKQEVSKEASSRFSMEYNPKDGQVIRIILNTIDRSLQAPQSFSALQQDKHVSWFGLKEKPKTESRKRGAAAIDQDEEKRPASQTAVSRVLSNRDTRESLQSGENELMRQRIQSQENELKV
jgi:hypothetical protein